MLNKLSDKFGLSPEQEEMVLGHFNEKDGLGYVIEKAKMACLPGVKNPGAYFIKAIEKGWKPPRLSPGPPKHRKAEPLPIQVPLVSELSDEQRSHTLAEIKKLKATI